MEILYNSNSGPLQAIPTYGDQPDMIGPQHLFHVLEEIIILLLGATVFMSVQVGYLIHYKMDMNMGGILMDAIENLICVSK